MPNGLLKSLLDFLYPATCLLCRVSTVNDNATSSVDGYLCAACQADLHVNQGSCSCCAIPVSAHNETKNNLCADCLKRAPAFDNSFSAYIYAQPLEWMIQQFKFNGNLALGSVLAKLMTEHLGKYDNNALPQVLIPMPLHHMRLKERGFNQSLILAREISKIFNVPVDNKSCRRIKNTEHQTGKTAKERVQNLKGAFVFENKNAYQHVVIVDDVVTTGSSVSELAKTLKRNGVARVDVWSLARANKS